MGRLETAHNNFDTSLLGKIGEELFAQQYTSAYRVDCFNHDFILSNKRIEVKTIAVNQEPTAGHRLSLHNADQICDFYYWFAVNINTFCDAWSLGFISKNDFIKSAHRTNKGDPIKNGAAAKYDSWDISVADLRKGTG